MTVVAGWNAHNAHEDILHNYVRDCVEHNAAGIVLTEVWSRHRELRKIAEKFRYKMISEPPGDRNGKIISEHGDTVMLVGRGVELLKSRFVVLDKRWEVVDHNNVHEPRRMPLAHVRDGAHNRSVWVGAHGPTKSNHAAVDDFKEHLDILLADRPADLEVLVWGDINFRLDEARPWARERDLHVDGYGPDLIFGNVKVESKRDPSKRSSDHYPMWHATR